MANVIIPKSENPLRMQASLGGKNVFRSTSGLDGNSYLLSGTVSKVYYQKGTLDFKLDGSNIPVQAVEGDDGTFSAPIPVDFFGENSEGQTYGHYRPVQTGSKIVVAYLSGKLNNPIVIGVYPSDSASYELVGGISRNTQDDTQEDVQDEVLSEKHVYPSGQILYRAGSGDIAESLQGKSFKLIQQDSMGYMDDIWYTYDALGLFNDGNNDQITSKQTLAGSWLLVHEDNNQANDEADGHMTRFYVDPHGKFQMVFGNYNDSSNLAVLEGSKDAGFTLTKFYDSNEPTDSSKDYVMMTLGDENKSIKFTASSEAESADQSSTLEVKSDDVYVNGKKLSDYINGVTNIDDALKNSDEYNSTKNKVDQATNNISELSKQTSAAGIAASQAAEQASQAGETAAQAGADAKAAGQAALDGANDIKSKIIYYTSISPESAGDNYVPGKFIHLTTTTLIDEGIIKNAYIENEAVDNSKIANLAVDSGKIADLAVTTGKIANLAVNSAQIADLAVTDAKVGTLSFDHMIGQTLDASQINVVKLKGESIDVGTITADKLIINSLGEITSNLGSVTNGEINAGTDSSSSVVIKNLPADNPNEYTPQKKSDLKHQIAVVESQANAAISYGNSTGNDVTDVTKARDALLSGTSELLADMTATTSANADDISKLIKAVSDAVTTFQNNVNSSLSAKIGSTADGKNAIYTGTQAPDSPHENDMWLKDNSDGTVTIQVYGSGAWYTPAQQAIQQVADKVDTLPKSYFSTSMPSGTDYKDGDLWYKTTTDKDTNRIVYTAYKWNHDTNTWEPMLDENSSKNYVGSEPASPLEGDFWMDNGVLKQYQSGTWTTIPTKGDDGVAGTTYYTHIAYANSEDGKTDFSTTAFTGSIYIGLMSDTTQEDSTDPTKYTWSKMRGDDGTNGRDGIEGKPGADGKSTYVHFAYANSEDGKTDFNVEYFSGALYVGTLTDTTQADSTTYTDYTWARLKGADGEAGANGNGIASTLIAYQVSTEGTDVPNGTWVDTIPTIPSGQYLWTRTTITLDDGTAKVAYSVSRDGKDGSDGKDGVAGKDGIGIKTTNVSYQASANGTTAPTGIWTTTVPNVPKGQYLWTKTVWAYTDNSTETGYSVAYVGTDGNDGTNGVAGKDGVGIINTVITYQSSTSGTTPPTGTWSSSVPTVSAGNYLWTKTVWKYSDNTSETGYSVAQAGKTGDKGADGSDGVGISSTVITYQLSTSGTTTPSGTWSNTVLSPTDASPYLWTRTVLTYSDNSTKTLYGISVKGTDGSDGVAGKDGVGISSTTITYQASTSGTTTPTGMWTSVVPTVTKGQYLWTKTVWDYSDNTSETGYSVAYIGTDGNDGTDGVAGKDGVGIKTTTITYAVADSGTTAPTTGWTATVHTANPGQYVWTKTVWTYTDNTSETGYSVAKYGTNGAKGADGSDGVGVSGSTITYQVSDNGTTVPAGDWVTTIPTVPAGKFLWTKTVFNYTDNTNSTAYSVSSAGTNGTNGKDGSDGKDGRGIKSSSVAYQLSNSGVTIPTGTWLSAPTEQTNTQPYLWTQTTVSYTDNTNSTSYSVSRKGDTGATGAAGKTYYTWIKYATDSSGSNMSDSPTGMTYLGIAYNKTTSTESSTATDYTWSLIKGEDGKPGTNGINGADGSTYYFHIAYAQSADGKTGFTIVPDTKISYNYMGTYTDTTKDGSTDNTKYIWVAMFDSTKKRNFTTQPTTPYAVGDTWTQSGATYFCTTARNSGAFTASDWTMQQLTIASLDSSIQTNLNNSVKTTGNYKGVTLNDSGLTATAGSTTVAMNSTDGFLIKNTSGQVFHVDTAGNLTMQGNITAGNISGVNFTGNNLNLNGTLAIGANGVLSANDGKTVINNSGLTIKDGGLSVEDSKNNQTTYIGSDGTFITNKGEFTGSVTTNKLILTGNDSDINMGGKFHVDKNGNLTATSANIANGSIDGSDITGSNFIVGNEYYSSLETTKHNSLNISSNGIRTGTSFSYDRGLTNDIPTIPDNLVHDSGNPIRFVGKGEQDVGSDGTATTSQNLYSVAEQAYGNIVTISATYRIDKDITDARGAVHLQQYGTPGPGWSQYCTLGPGTKAGVHTVSQTINLPNINYSDTNYKGAQIRGECNYYTGNIVISHVKIEIAKPNGVNILKGTDPTALVSSSEDGWTVSSGGDGAGSIVETPGRATSHGFQILNNTTGNRDFLQIVTKKLTKGWLYMFTVDARVLNDGDTATALIRLWDVKNNTALHRYTTSINSSSWNQITFGFPADIVDGQAYNIQFGLTGAGSAQFANPKLSGVNTDPTTWIASSYDSYATPKITNKVNLLPPVTDVDSGLWLPANGGEIKKPDYFDWTDSSMTIDADWANDSYILHLYNNWMSARYISPSGEKLKNGQKYTVAFQARTARGTTNTSKLPFAVYTRKIDGTDINIANADSKNNYATYGAKFTWFALPFTPSEDYLLDNFRVEPHGSWDNVGGSIYMKNIVLIEGDVDWGTDPEFQLKNTTLNPTNMSKSISTMDTTGLNQGDTVVVQAGVSFTNSQMAMGATIQIQIGSTTKTVLAQKYSLIEGNEDYTFSTTWNTGYESGTNVPITVLLNNAPKGSFWITYAQAFTTIDASQGYGRVSDSYGYLTPYGELRLSHATTSDNADVYHPNLIDGSSLSWADGVMNIKSYNYVPSYDGSGDIQYNTREDSIYGGYTTNYEDSSAFRAASFDTRGIYYNTDIHEDGAIVNGALQERSTGVSWAWNDIIGSAMNGVGNSGIQGNISWYDTMESISNYPNLLANSAMMWGLNSMNTQDPSWHVNNAKYYWSNFTLNGGAASIMVNNGGAADNAWQHVNVSGIGGGGTLSLSYWAYCWDADTRTYNEHGMNLSFEQKDGKNNGTVTCMMDRQPPSNRWVKYQYIIDWQDFFGTNLDHISVMFHTKSAKGHWGFSKPMLNIGNQPKPYVVTY